MNKIGQVLGGVHTFLTEVQVELKKCSWPGRSELLESTVVVIISVLILGVFIGVSDIVLLTFMRLVVR
jgi:preprotein translocase subunit SecE